VEEEAELTTPRGATSPSLDLDADKADIARALTASATVIQRLLKTESDRSNGVRIPQDVVYKRLEDINGLAKTVVRLKGSLDAREAVYKGREEAFKREIALLRATLNSNEQTRSVSPLKRVKAAISKSFSSKPSANVMASP
jgi:hypothetical protein